MGVGEGEVFVLFTVYHFLQSVVHKIWHESEERITGATVMTSSCTHSSLKNCSAFQPDLPFELMSVVSKRSHSVTLSYQQSNKCPVGWTLCVGSTI